MKNHRFSGLPYYLFLLVSFSPVKIIHSQTQFNLLDRNNLVRSYQVRLVMKDSSRFFGTVIQKPLPDRIIFLTRNGRLEIPLNDIDYAIDYRFNTSLNRDLDKGVAENTTEIEKYHLKDSLVNSTSERSSVISTIGHDIYMGYQYSIGDPKHIILSTDWGELYFAISDIAKITDHFEVNPPKEYYYIPDFIPKEKKVVPMIVTDPMASQGYITPNGIAFGKDNIFLADYLFGGLQMNYGPTDWLSMNLGGVYLPLNNNIIVGTTGAKFSPYSSELWHISAGGQVMYSQVLKITHLGLAYGAVTYGGSGSQLTLFGGYTINHTDSAGHSLDTKHDRILAIQGAEQVGNNFKLGMEFFFISNFEIVPLILSLRYFTNNLTIDFGVVLSLYEAGAARTMKTLGEYVFNVPDYSIVPLISGSYHF
jgi:hypothetical protein